MLEDLRQGLPEGALPAADRSGLARRRDLNTAGGVAGGDRLDLDVSRCAEGAQLDVAAQAAERFYRAAASTRAAAVRTASAVVAAGAALEWLPQETILFDRCALRPPAATSMLAADAWFLGVESLVFGRAAMGETVEKAWLRDLIRVRRGGGCCCTTRSAWMARSTHLLQRPAIAAGCTRRRDGGAMSRRTPRRCWSRCVTRWRVRC